jgi:hypothetical protein
MLGRRAVNAPAVIEALPRSAARMLAVEILLLGKAEPESLGDDVLESCLYIPGKN